VPGDQVEFPAGYCGIGLYKHSEQLNKITPDAYRRSVVENNLKQVVFWQIEKKIKEEKEGIINTIESFFVEKSKTTKNDDIRRIRRK
jgi:hypothetical protein